MTLKKKSLPITKASASTSTKKQSAPKAKLDTKKPADSKVIAALRIV